MVVQGLMVEAEMVVMAASVGWMVVKAELRVGGGAVALGLMEVELGGGSVMVTLLQDLQHMRW